jgi:hypothetical protein
MPWRINSRRTEQKHRPQQCFHFLSPYLLPGRHELVELSLMLRPKVSRPVLPGTKHPSGAHNQISITVRQSRTHRCGAPSYLMRGRLRRPHLLPVLSSAFILESEYRGTRDNTPLGQIRNFTFRRLPRPTGHCGGTRPLLQMGLVISIIFLKLTLFVFEHTEHSRLLKKLLQVYSTEVNRFIKAHVCFPRNIVLDANLLKILLTSFNVEDVIIRGYK